ncbi:hypothetical protein EV421DRAFT_2026202 [Armillaria borealis]|uniref:Protein kinase domain-containing protein n=1 Tax=Armillaria borealis TaxID=47425 RepID=A0AA39M5P7_9AGAR|nr:hypothetical protein EV421DRAFT_2026202 [Armillaria borealis]
MKQRLQSLTWQPSGFSSSHEQATTYIHLDKIQFKLQAQGSPAFKDLAATVAKRFEPSTCSVVLLVERAEDSQPLIVKLADRRLGYRNYLKTSVPWTSKLEERLRQAVRKIQAGAVPDWFELIHDREKRPDQEDWEDWMWEVSTWNRKLADYERELAAYHLLHRLQGNCIPRFFGVVHFPITSDSTPLHPIADFVQGLALEYIPGVSMENLEPGVDFSLPEAEIISSKVLDAFRTIEAENCVLHNDIHIGNIVLRDADGSPVIIDFGRASVRDPGCSDLEWRDNVEGGADTRFMRRVLRDPKYGVWKRTVTPFETQDYRTPLEFNEYVESMPEDFVTTTFEKVLGTDWDGAREKLACHKMGVLRRSLMSYGAVAE